MHIFSSMEVVGVKSTSMVFKSLINVCLFSGDIVTTYGLFEIMESSERCKPDFRTYDNFISSFYKSGNADSMLDWYLAKKVVGLGSDLRIFELVLMGCVNAKKFEIVDRIFEEMMVSEIIPNGTILESMLKGFCEQKSLCRGKEFVRFMLDNMWEISGTMVEMLIALYHEQKRVEKMEELLETMTKLLVDSSALLQIHCEILRMYAVLDRLDDVELFVGKMLKTSDVVRKLDDVEKVICSYFRNEAYDMLDIFLECIKNSHVLTRSTFDLLIFGYRRANLHEKVDLVLLDMKSMGLA